jgi:uncharacterized protein YgbK (DUF1537 family)
MNRLVIIADDLTGAADTAACFAQGGLATVVKLDLETRFFPENPVSSPSRPEIGFSRKHPISSWLVSGEIDVLSLSTNSRELDPPEAARRVRQAADWLVHGRFTQPGTFFYKKIDSMLRGHPALELAALMGALGLDRALVAPAFPAQGRVTRAGWQVIAADSLAQRINLAEVFAVSDRSGITIADAETEADLDRLARAALAGGLRLACGSAGLARALWRCGVVGVVSASSAAAGNTLPDKKPILVVAGSRSTTLERQVQAARERGVVVVRPGLDWLECADFQPGELVITLAEPLQRGQAAILTTAGLPDSTLGAVQVATRLAEVAGQLVESGLVGGLVLTGGDTALAVCRRLGASLIGLGGEPVPGVASGVLLDGACSGLPVVTRAGGFECDLAWLINLRV